MPVRVRHRRGQHLPSFKIDRSEWHPLESRTCHQENLLFSLDEWTSEPAHMEDHTPSPASRGPRSQDDTRKNKVVTPRKMSFLTFLCKGLVSFWTIRK